MPNNIMNNALSGTQAGNFQFSGTPEEQLQIWVSQRDSIKGDHPIAKQQREAYNKLIGELQQAISQNETQNMWQSRFNELSNPESGLYKSFQSSLTKTLNNSTPTTDSLLGVALAMGGDYGGSSVIANKQREAAEGRNREAASGATQGYFNQNQGLASSALGGFTQNEQFGRSLIENARQFNESLQFQKDQQPTFGTNLLNIASSVAGNVNPMNWFGKKSGNKYQTIDPNGVNYYG